MTNKLYYQDSHLTACVSRVLSCVPGKGGFDVLLDQTVLFPTGGGQQCDLGTVGDANVLDCREAGADVVHTLDKAVTEGTEVAVSLNWERRFDYMQQHTGEHLLSFAFYTLFSAANVGFHLADGYTTIDFDKPLTHDQLTEAEGLANSYVWRNLPVTATLYPDEAAIRDLPLRKHAEGLTAPIRVVQVEDADCCTCCAPHCKTTGEVGSIFITDAASYKGGTRITFLCGKRALQNARLTHDRLDAIARRFSASREQAVDAVNKMGDELTASRHKERDYAKELNGYVAAELLSQGEKAGKRTVVTRLFDHMDSQCLKDLAQLTVKGKDTLALLMSKQGDKLAYVLAESEGFPVDVSELMPAVNAALNGKGGGRGTLAQGMAQKCDGAGEALLQIHGYFLQRLK